MEVSVTLPNTFNGDALRKHFKQGFEQGNRGFSYYTCRQTVWSFLVCIVNQYF